MRNFKNGVAVITGSGSGIGKGFAERCVAEQMKVVLADINQNNLDKVEAELLKHTSSDRILSLKIDVGRKQDILLLAEKTKQKFGRVDLLFNHAGIPGPIGPIWKASYEEIEKVVQVNLLSTMYSLKSFVPMMLQQETPGHIVNTSSGAGLQIAPDMSGYGATKRAIVALSEILSIDLHAAKSKIGVSVLCPGMVATNFADMIPEVEESNNSSAENFKRFIKDNLQSKGLPISKVVDETFDAIRNERFYILTHIDEHRENIKNLTDNMLSGGNPIALFEKENV